MKASSAVIFLLISASLGMQELDEASCTNAPVKSDRSLIQYQKAADTPLQLTESAGNEETADRVKIAAIFAEVLAQAEAEEEEKEKGPALLNTAWTGLMVDVELAESAPDMQNCVEKFSSDYAASDDVATALASNVSKPYLEMSFPNLDGGGQVVSNASSDKVQMFGFTRGTTGLINVNANRIWTKTPGSPDAMLVYGFTMMEVPGTMPWKYNIEYSITPPGTDVFKVYPPGGKVAQVGNNLAVVMTCNHEDFCKDKKINIAAVQFKPAGDTMPEPEEIVGKEESLVARQDTRAQQAGSMFGQVLMRNAAARR